MKEPSQSMIHLCNSSWLMSLGACPIEYISIVVKIMVALIFSRLLHLNNTFTMGCHQHQRVLSSVQFLHIPCSFEVFWKRSEERCYCSNSLRISAISLIFWWVDKHYSEGDCYWNWVCLANFCALDGTLKFFMIGLKKVWGTTLLLLILEGFWQSVWNWMILCTVPWNRSFFELAMLCQFLCIPQYFKFSW